jgi:hypothetical protein
MHESRFCDYVKLELSRYSQKKVSLDSMNCLRHCSNRICGRHGKRVRHQASCSDLQVWKCDQAIDFAFCIGTGQCRSSSLDDHCSEMKCGLKWNAGCTTILKRLVEQAAGVTLPVEAWCICWRWLPRCYNSEMNTIFHVFYWEQESTKKGLSKLRYFKLPIATVLSIDWFLEKRFNRTMRRFYGSRSVKSAENTFSWLSSPITAKRAQQSYWKANLVLDLIND